MKNTFLLFLWMSVVLGSCEKLPENSPTYGFTRVVADETLYPVVDALERMFEHTYPNAKVEIAYLPETQAFQQFYNDSNLVILSTRALSAEETSFFSKKNINPRTALFANDAIALLVNQSNPDTNLTCEQAIEIFNGKTQHWNQLRPDNASGEISLVFDHQASSTVRFILEKTGVKSLPSNTYALKTTEAVVEYVNTHKGALGIVGYSWLGDYDDPQCRKFRSQVQVAAISRCGGGKPSEFFEPFAANVEAQNYPFTRQVFVINRETNSGLGTGFSAYIAGEVGQRIVSKTGILPAYKVEHKIELKSEPFRVEN